MLVFTQGKADYMEDTGARAERHGDAVRTVARDTNHEGCKHGAEAGGAEDAVEAEVAEEKSAVQSIRSRSNEKDELEKGV